MLGIIANDDLLLFSVMTITLLYLWDYSSKIIYEPVTQKNNTEVNVVQTHSQANLAKKVETTPLPLQDNAVEDQVEVVVRGSEVVRRGSMIEYNAGSGKKPKVLPFLPGCEPDGPAAKQMLALHPDVEIEDIVRFLVARKGVVSAASEMLTKSEAWRKSVFPLKKEVVAPALESKCMFYHGIAKDGTSCIYFRGGLYDKTKADPLVYATCAAHTINEALQRSDLINLTVLVHTSSVEGGVNAPADMAFIKAFVSLMSDNYPERLKRLILYPFPWWARAIWAVVKPFLDKRTQDKIVMLPGDTSIGCPPPKELFEYVDAREVPPGCGGVDDRPIINILDTIAE